MEKSHGIPAVNPKLVSEVARVVVKWNMLAISNSCNQTFMGTTRGAKVTKLGKRCGAGIIRTIYFAILYSKRVNCFYGQFI
uniref:Uncharacterized protein n=1 Tax=Hyaloperonospora arabidopsidis (strain Emoy2) TaxID=559515 RepID=M4BTN4_HYAAE